MTTVRRAYVALLALAIVLCLGEGAASAQSRKTIAVNKERKRSAPVPAQRAGALDELLRSVQPTQAATDRARVQGVAAQTQSPRVAVKDNDYVRFLSSRAEGIFPVRAAAQTPEIAADPEKLAYAFLGEQRSLFVADSAKTTFVTRSVKRDSGRSYVRVQQKYADIPVFGAEMILQVRDGEGVAAVLSRVMSETGPFDNGLIRTAPHFTAADAQNAAVLYLAKDYPQAILKADGGELTIYDPQIFDEQGLPEPAWKVHVGSLNSLTPNEEVLVSALRNEVLFHHSRVYAGRYRTVYDTDGNDLPTLHPTTISIDQRIDYTQTYTDYGRPRRWEEEMLWLGISRGNGGYDWPSTGIPELDSNGNEIYPNDNLAFENLGFAYQWYFDHFGRISFDNGLLRHTILTTSGTFTLQDDGLGSEIIASINMPMDNAYWDEMVDRMYVGNTFALQAEAGFEVLDVMAHEYTHGVTEYESGLIYSAQSGAMNEAFSDMFGEWIDQEYPSNAWNSTLKWRLGEMIGQLLMVLDGGQIGSEYDTTPGVLQQMVVRDMKNPPLFGAADRLRSKLYYKGPLDYGGVHSNCGVVDKLVYLLTDGDSFNGQTVQGMGAGYGLTATPQIFYEAQIHLLYSAATFEDLYFCLLQAADNFGFSDSLIANIEAACRAVEIATPTLSEAYTITYKDRNPAIQAQIVDKVGQEMVNEIRIADPSAAGSLKIRKNRGFTSYPFIQAILTQGSLDKVFSEASIGRIVSDGVIRSLTVKDGYARRVEANEVGSVKMTSYNRSWSLATGDIPLSLLAIGPGGYTNDTSIYSIDLSTSPNPRPMPLKLNLVGTGLYALQAPVQVVSISASSKKFLFNTTGGRPNEDVSYAGIEYFGVDPYFRFDPALRSSGTELTDIVAGQFGKVSTKGSSIVYPTAYWNGATTVTAQLVPGKTDISAKSQVFSLTYNGVPSDLLPTTATSAYFADYMGWIECSSIWSNSQDTSVRADGGYVWVSGLYASGNVSLISAKTSRHLLVDTVFVTDPATSVTTAQRIATNVWDFGGVGYWYYDISGYLNEAYYGAGLALDSRYADIGKVWGDACVQGAFCGGRQLVPDPLTGLLRWDVFGDVKSMATPATGTSSGPPGLYFVCMVEYASGSILFYMLTGPLTAPTTVTLGSDPIYMNGDVWSNRPTRVRGGDSWGMQRHFAVTD